MNKIIIASFISIRTNFSNGQTIIFNIPSEYAPDRLIEFGATGDVVGATLNLSVDGKLILFCNSPASIIRFQTMWHTA